MANKRSYVGKDLSRRRVWTVALSALGTCLLATFVISMSFRLPGPQSPSRPSELTPFYRHGQWGSEFAGEMAAADRGVFEAHGVGIRLRPLPKDDEFFSAVIRDRAIGVTTGQKFLLARWRGIPIVAFGASFLDTSTVIVSLQKSGIRVPRDLVGKRLGYRLGAEALVVYNAMMAQLGLPRSQVSLVPQADLFGSLRRGEVEAVVAAIGELRPSFDGEAMQVSVMKPQDYGIHIPGLVYVAASELARENPSIIQQVLRGVIVGWQTVYSDLDNLAISLADHDPERLTPELVRFGLIQQRNLVLTTESRIAEFDESRWNALRDILLFSKAGEQTESLSAGVNYQFLRDAYRRPLNAESAKSTTF